MMNQHRILLHSTSDIVTARLQAREFAIQLGFGGFEVTLITAAISNVARFVVHQSKCGELLLEVVKQGEKSGIRITAQAESALSSEKTEPCSAPLGPSQKSDTNMPNLQGLMHELNVVSNTSGDTTFIMKRWK